MERYLYKLLKGGQDGLFKRSLFRSKELCCILDDKADLVDGKVPIDQLPVGFVGAAFFDTFNALNLALPQPGQAVDTIVGVRNSQGIEWLPGSLGGTWYPEGFYRSTGLEWRFFGKFPYQATQVEMDAGVNNDKFGTPLTINNLAKWDTKQNAIQFQEDGANLGTPGTVDEVDVTGDLTAVRVGNKITINYTGSSTEAIIQQYTAGEVINGGKALYMNADGKVYHLDITDPSTYLQYIGIASQSAILNDPVNVVVQGKTQVLGSGWIAGQRYWIAATGFLATTPPATGLAKAVGVGVDADTINIIDFTEYIKT